MDDHLVALAESNGGYLHRADIIENLGSDHWIRTAVREGVLRRIRVGTFAPAATWDGLSGTDKHLVLCRAVIDKFADGSVALSHHSAAATHGLALYGADLSVVHVVRLDGSSGRQESGIVHHLAAPEADEIVRLGDRLVTHPARAVWEVACAAPSRSGLVVVDSGLNSGLVLPEHLADHAGRYRRWPGARSARLTIRLADGGAETPGESLMRFTCFEAKLPRPDTQVVVLDPTGRFVARTDVGWELLRHLGEFDGLRKYWRDLRGSEDASDVVLREKLREDKIRALGYGMSRTVWSEVQPDTSVVTGARLAHELEQSHRIYAAGRVHIA